MIKKKTTSNRKIFIIVSSIILTLIAMSIIFFTVLNRYQGSKQTALKGDVSLEDLVADPERYVGASVDGVAEAFSVDKSGDMYVIQAYTDLDNKDDVVVIYAQVSDLIDEGEYFEFEGTVDSVLNGENAYGASLIRPVVFVSDINLIDADKAIAPANSVKNLNISKTVGGLTVTLQKIEYAENESRLYFKFDNNGDSDYSFYDFNATLVQGRKKLDRISDYSRDTYSYDSDITAGTLQLVKLYYEPLSLDTSSKYTMQVYNSDNYEEQTLTFNISASR